MPSTDILILSNGPGELSTWVRPVVRALRQQLGAENDRVRISLVLSPCPHASGNEAQIARLDANIDRVQEATAFWPFLLWGKTVRDWDWRERGVVLFLGGDRFFAIAIGRRLGYRTLVYAEWDARWQGWIDRFAVMKPDVIQKAAARYRHKFSVVGDLMTDAAIGEYAGGLEIDQKIKGELIGILPGSKAIKLSQGLPLGLAIAECIRKQRPQTIFVIPVAPTLDTAELSRFANPQSNPIIRQLGWTAAKLVMPTDRSSDAAHLPFDLDRAPYLETASGVRVYLYTRTPAYDLLSQCCLCLTTVGANTAELASLAVPMLVMLPTQQPDAIRALEGLPGVLANLPGVGWGFAHLINKLVERKVNRLAGKSLLAWPNIWAQAQIVPESIGVLNPETVASLALDYLSHPEKLEAMRDRLRQVRGEPGAAQKLAQMAIEEIGNW
jgi:hypothetical protein